MSQEERAWSGVEAFLRRFQSECSPGKWFPVRKGAWVILRLVLMVLLLAATLLPVVRWLAGLMALLLIGEVVLVHASIAFVTKNPESQLRSLVFAVGGYATLVVGFGVFYALFPDQLDPALNLWTAVYFSLVTATTLGYGDFKPCENAWAVQGLVVVEVLVAVSFLAVIVATFVNMNGSSNEGSGGSQGEHNA